MAAKKIFFLLLSMLASASAFVPVVTPVVRSTPLAAKGKVEEKKKSAWEIYTDGEYGQAFKLPWENEFTDKTIIGHVRSLLTCTDFSTDHPRRCRRPYHRSEVYGIVRNVIAVCGDATCAATVVVESPCGVYSL